MAENIEYKITIDGAEKSFKNVKDLSKGIEYLKKQLGGAKSFDEFDKVSKDIAAAEKQVQKLGAGAKKAGEGTKGITAGFKAAGLALKAMGIGLLIEAFGVLKEVFMSNQAVVDTFSTAINFLKIAFNDLIGFITKSVGPVTDFFKEMFENPKQMLIDFGNLIKDNLIERFNSFLDTLGYVASAIKKIFTGDFSGAMDDAKKASKEFVDVMTGVNNTVDRVVETVGEVIDATINYTKENWKAAASLTAIGKAAKFAAEDLNGIREEYDRLEEIQRQIRDNDLNSIEERIKANEELGRLLEEDKKKRLEQLNIIKAEAQAQYNLNKSDENKLKLMQVNNEIKATEAELEGKISEQKQNNVNLTKEQLSMNQSIIDANNERQKSESDFQEELKAGSLEGLELQRKNLDEESKLEEERLRNKRDTYKQGTQAYVDADNELKAAQQENAHETIRLDKQIKETRIESANAIGTSIGDTLTNLTSLAGENADAQRAAALIQVLTNQGLALSNAAVAAFSPASPDNVFTGGVAGAAKLIGFIASLTGLFAGIKSSMSMANGGVVSGPSHARGGVQFSNGGAVTELEGGEGVINKRSMSIPAVRNIASTLNGIGGGESFGIPNTNSSAIKQDGASIVKNDQHTSQYVVSVVDINRAQRQNNVTLSQTRFRRTK